MTPRDGDELEGSVEGVYSKKKAGSTPKFLESLGNGDRVEGQTLAFILLQGSGETRGNVIEDKRSMKTAYQSLGPV